MKSKIEQLIALRNQADPIELEINAAVITAALRYATADALRYPSFDRPTKINSIDGWVIDGRGDVSVRWSESWKYGGYAEGVFTFPAETIYSEDAMAAWELDCASVKTANEQKTKAERTAADVAEFRRLQSKLGKEAQS